MCCAVVPVQLSRTPSLFGLKTPKSREDVYIITNWLRYHLYSTWLFTRSDIKTIILPKTIFGILGATATSAFGLPSEYAIRPVDALLQAPVTALWVWSNLLPFAIDNQRHWAAIEEDRINKSWRAMPSGRMTQAQAKKFMLCSYITTAFISWRVGGMAQCLALMILGCWYNDLGGADNSCVVRNLINGLGYVSFSSGAMEVAVGHSLLPYANILTSVAELHGLSKHNFLPLWNWLGILIIIVFTTTHAQDMHDQAGDRARGRRTVPLVIGDVAARISIVISVGIWSIFCALYWDVGALGFGLVGILAAVVGIRTMALRRVRDDKKTFMFWNAWITAVYMLPLLSLVGRH
ncbi:uncharacterized protein BDR25DRAFT_379884 [Lindgomyces ingoldianus]|uniref:Uncharacterized protein n=1 Tax=Lindgomyces ingoldianus TaxID=673940 RepID=A0ACB6QG68_9PLEO|nr:uncharacterized protein BDR25DRAFT_379884 [Lindgomyces ingoldianus]KAF2465140.1 hypothetical protein BDR25DRAFT_379884 [Lindgomyces ingoldianus]